MLPGRLYVTGSIRSGGPLPGADFTRAVRRRLLATASSDAGSGLCFSAQSWEAARSELTSMQHPAGPTSSMAAKRSFACAMSAGL
jgi:hypothetical protein